MCSCSPQEHTYKADAVSMNTRISCYRCRCLRCCCCYGFSCCWPRYGWVLL